MIHSHNLCWFDPSTSSKSKNFPWNLTWFSENQMVFNTTKNNDQCQTLLSNQFLALGSSIIGCFPLTHLCIIVSILHQEILRSLKQKGQTSSQHNKFMPFKYPLVLSSMYWWFTIYEHLFDAQKNLLCKEMILFATLFGILNIES